MLIFGVAGGLTLPAVTTLAMAGATDTDAGLASGLANTTQQVGGAVGLAALATLAAARSDGLRAAGWAETAALAGGYRTAFAVAAGSRGRRVAGGADHSAPTLGRAVVGRRPVGPGRGGCRNRSVPKRRVRLTDGSQPGRVVG